MQDKFFLFPKASQTLNSILLHFIIVNNLLNVQSRNGRKTRKDEVIQRVALPFSELCFISFSYTAVLAPDSMQRSEVILLDGCKPQGNPLLRE